MGAESSSKIISKDRIIHSLLSMGTKGYYPLFEEIPLHTVHHSLNNDERKRAFHLLERLSKHRGIDRKKTVLLTLSSEDQDLVVRLFFELVGKKLESARGVIQ